MEDASAERLIDVWLARLLGAPVQALSYRPLGTGISGAVTCRVTLPGGEAVLKVTPASSPQYVQARAARELAFYRALATRVPLGVPRVIAMHADGEGTALLLAVHGESRPPAQWREEQIGEALRQIGRFHGMFWNRTAALACHEWLLRPDPAAVYADMDPARDYWRGLHEQPRFSTILTEPVFRWVRRLIDVMPAIDAIIHSLPLTLCHGDCHPGNVLLDDHDVMVWVDWQEVRIARGPEDLSFFLQQASIAGAVYSSMAALSAYREGLMAEVREDVPLMTIRRVVDAAELRSRSLHWPAYLAGAAAADVAAMLQRMRDLAKTLEIEPLVGN